MTVVVTPPLGTVAGTPAAHRGQPGWLRHFPFPDGGRLVLAVSGEADVSTAGQLRDQLADALGRAPTALLLDVSDLGFCDLAGLDVIHEAMDAARRSGTPMTVRGMSPLLSWLHRSIAPRIPRQASDLAEPARRDAEPGPADLVGAGDLRRARDQGGARADVVARVGERVGAPPPRAAGVLLLGPGDVAVRERGHAAVVVGEQLVSDGHAVSLRLVLADPGI